LISLKGECREATVWFGSLAGPHAFRATALPSGDSISADPLSVMDKRGTDLLPNTSSILILPLCVQDSLMWWQNSRTMQRLDAEEEYLTGAMNAAPPRFVTAFRIEAVLSGNVERAEEISKERSVDTL
jgi:hypothetical protein